MWTLKEYASNREQEPKQRYKNTKNMYVSNEKKKITKHMYECKNFCLSEFEARHFGASLGTWKMDLHPEELLKIN